MKPQDIILLITLGFFIWINNKNWTSLAGLIFIIFSILLFAFHIFFTAEHLLYFAALYFLTAAIQSMKLKIKS